MKTHLNLRVRDLKKSVSFYRTLLEIEPIKQFDDYALFITEEPGLELALDADRSLRLAESAHYGVVVDSPDVVGAAIARLKAANLPADVEREETCCYALQTKVWTADPDGRRWGSLYRFERDRAARRLRDRVLQPLAKRVVSEAIGTAFLLAAVVGSGIMAERLSGGNGAVALLANAIATGAVLIAIILTFGAISGAHFNPAVTLADAWQGGLRWREAPFYIVAQLVGAILGVAVANTMFGEPIFFASHRARHGFPVLLGEFVATFGLLAVIWGCVRFRNNATAYAVAAYIVGAYWFTASIVRKSMPLPSRAPCPTLLRGLRRPISAASLWPSCLAHLPQPRSSRGSSEHCRLRFRCTVISIQEVHELHEAFRAFCLPS